MPESPDELPRLRALVGHREFVRADDSLEMIQRRLSASRQDFFAVLDGHRLLGMCARRDIGTLLGARFGFALHARSRVADHLTPYALRFTADDPITDTFVAISARRDEHFYDDVLLTDRSGEFLGLIYVRDLMRVQHTLLRENLDELSARNRQIEDDLQMAREVQMALLPREFSACRAPDGAALTFAHRFEPAGTVSGDFFDVFPIGPSAAGVLVCDVMGHGVRSALVTAMTRTMLEQLRPHASVPGDYLTQLNASLSRLLRRAGDLIFVTASYLCVDAAARSVTYAHAGHPPPLHWRVGDATARPIPHLVRLGGPALGLLEDTIYETGELVLGAGDRLLVYTDGVTEAANAQGEEYSESRLADSFAAVGAEPLDRALARLHGSTTDFAGGVPIADDVCLVACEFLAGVRP